VWCRTDSVSRYVETTREVTVNRPIRPVHRRIYLWHDARAAVAASLVEHHHLRRSTGVAQPPRTNVIPHCAQVPIQPCVSPDWYACSWWREITMAVAQHDRFDALPLI